MAISGSIDFTVTRDDIITEALELIGVIGEGESPTADQLTSSSRTLNMLVKSWQADGLNLFAVQKGFLVLLTDQISYDLNISSSDLFLSSVVASVTTADTSVGGDTLTLSSTTGISVSDTVDVIIDGTAVSGTVLSVDSSTVITTDQTYTNGVDSGSRVLVYDTANALNRPMNVMECYYHNIVDDTDTPVEVLSRRKYNELSDKNVSGRPNQVYYDPQIGTGVLYVWPASSVDYDYLTVFCQRTLSDFDSATDNPDYPQEWYLPLSLNLAVLIAPKYGVPDQEYYKLVKLAQAYYDIAKGYDQELYTSFYFEPDKRGMGYNDY